jgi:hypothetical protein
LIGYFRVIAAAVSVAFMTVGANAQELPPLTDNMLNLRAAIDRGGDPIAIHPVVLPNLAFEQIAPHVVVTFDLLERFGLAAASDRVALAEYAQHVVEARLDELGASDDIAVAAAPLVPFDVDCDTLGLMFDFQAKELPTEHGPVVAVVVDAVLLQRLTITHPDGSKECLRSPVASEIADRALLVLERGQREKALAEFQQAILRTVDFAVLRRVLNTNPSAYDRVKSWVQSAN